MFLILTIFLLYSSSPVLFSLCFSFNIQVMNMSIQPNDLLSIMLISASHDDLYLWHLGAGYGTWVWGFSDTVLGFADRG